MSSQHFFHPFLYLFFLSVSFICFFHLFLASIFFHWDFYLFPFHFPSFLSLVDLIILHTPLTPFIPTSPYAASPPFPLLPLPNPSKLHVLMHVSVPCTEDISD